MPLKRGWRDRGAERFSWLHFLSGASWGRTGKAAAQGLCPPRPSSVPACPLRNREGAGPRSGTYCDRPATSCSPTVPSHLYYICFSTHFPCQARTLLRVGRNTVLPFERNAFTCTAAQPVHRATNIRVISTQHRQGSAQEETKYSAPRLWDCQRNFPLVLPPAGSGPERPSTSPEPGHRAPDGKQDVSRALSTDWPRGHGRATVRKAVFRCSTSTPHKDSSRPVLPTKWHTGPRAAAVQFPTRYSPGSACRQP